MISREINDEFMVIIKGVEQNPDIGMKHFHPSIDDDSKSTNSDKEENKDENFPKTLYDGGNMNASFYYEVNNDEDAPETPYDGENTNAYSNNEVNNYEISPNHL